MKFFIKIVFIISFSVSTLEASIKPGQQKKYNLSIAAIFRDEARFLREWIEFHKVVGVEHFWLYNNLSRDNYYEVLLPYIQQGVVELIDWPYESHDAPSWNSIQCKAYMDGIKRSTGRSHWVAFLDTDEFLFPTEEENLVSFLRGFGDSAAVTANWQMFGTSGIERIPFSLLMIEQLTWKVATEDSENLHVKTIVRPSTVKTCSNPHHFELKPGFFQVDSQKRVFNGPYSPIVDVSKIRINHYWSRDLAFMREVKVARRLLWGMPVDGIYAHEARMNAVYDFSIQRFSDRVRATLNLHN